MVGSWEIGRGFARCIFDKCHDKKYHWWCLCAFRVNRLSIQYFSLTLSTKEKYIPPKSAINALEKHAHGWALLSLTYIGCATEKEMLGKQQNEY